MLNAFKSALDYVRQNGLRATYHHSCVRAADRWTEWRLAIDTAMPEDAASTRPDMIPYRALPYVSFAPVLRHISVDPQRDVFLDYGSGKGRVCVMAAMYPFKKVFGVEICPKLSELARENVERARRKLQCKDIEIVTANALEFDVPDETTVFHFFNPFQGTILDHVVEEIGASLRRVPRQATVLYANPRRFEEVAAERAWIVRRTDVIWPHYKIRTRPDDLDGKFRHRIYDLVAENLDRQPT